MEVKNSHMIPVQSKKDDVQLLLQKYEKSHEKFDDFTESDVGKVFEWAGKFVDNKSVSNDLSEQAHYSSWNDFSSTRVNMTLLLGGRLYCSYCTLV